MPAIPRPRAVCVCVCVFCVCVYSSCPHGRCLHLPLSLTFSTPRARTQAPQHAQRERKGESVVRGGGVGRRRGERKRKRERKIERERERPALAARLLGTITRSGTVTSPPSISVTAPPSTTCPAARSISFPIPGTESACMRMYARSVGGGCWGWGGSESMSFRHTLTPPLTPVDFHPPATPPVSPPARTGPHIYTHTHTHTHTRSHTHSHCLAQQAPLPPFLRIYIS